VEHARQCGARERHACRLVDQPRGTQRYQPTQRSDEDTLTRAIVTLDDRSGRDGYRRITIKLREAGWNVGKDRVERIWRREGPKVPQKQKPRSLKEAQVLAERWRIYYNTDRPHSSLGYRPPAPTAWQIEVPLGHGKVGSKQRFPLSHAPELRRRVN
jgi:transposase InsO family protein